MKIQLEDLIKDLREQQQRLKQESMFKIENELYLNDIETYINTKMKESYTRFIGDQEVSEISLQ